MEGNSIPRFWNRSTLKAKGGEHIRTFFGWSFPLRRCADWRAWVSGTVFKPGQRRCSSTKELRKVPTWTRAGVPGAG